MIPDVLYMTVPFLLLLALFCLNWWRVMRVEKMVEMMRGEIEDDNADWEEDFLRDEEDNDEDPRD